MDKEKFDNNAKECPWYKNGYCSGGELDYRCNYYSCPIIFWLKLNTPKDKGIFTLLK